MEATIVKRLFGILFIIFGMFNILYHKRTYELYIRRTIFVKKIIKNIISKSHIIFFQKYFQDTRPNMFEKAMARYTQLVVGLVFLLFGLLVFFGIITINTQ